MKSKMYLYAYFVIRNGTFPRQVLSCALIADADMLAFHAGRVTIKREDMKLAADMRASRERP